MRKPTEATPEAASPSTNNQEPAASSAKPGLAAEWEDLDAFTKQLPDSDGVPLESPWHVGEISLLITVLSYFWRDRNDFFAGGNNFLYYSPARARDKDFRGPDFYYVSGVERFRPRRFWAVWQEQGKFPDLIIELISPTTAQIDRTTKKELYERVFRTPEYFCYDPDTNHLQGWRLKDSSYQEIVADERGWMWSEVLQLWLGTWNGEYHGLSATWLRFYDAERRLVMHKAEALQEQMTALQAECAQLKTLLAHKEPSSEAQK